MLDEAAMTTMRARVGVMVVVVLGLAACDRFRHAKFEKSPWGTSGGTDTTTGEGAECSPTAPCAPSGPGQGTLVVIGSGSSGRGGSQGDGDAGPLGDGPGCGLTYEDPSCDACMQRSCCRAETACANDPACSETGACADACPDDACLDTCDEAYASNRAARELDACLRSSCSDVCG